MNYLQISAGRGPVECQRAVYLLVKELEKEFRSEGMDLELVDAVKGQEKDSYLSALLSFDAELSTEQRRSLEGSVKWLCASPFRKKHKRKNWFVGLSLLTQSENYSFDLNKLRYEACRSSGPGGQHVNTCSSAVRVVCDELALSARASEERSQHRNKALALARLQALVEAKNKSASAEAKVEHWMNHNQLERGDPVRIYKSEAFKRSQ